MTEAELLSDAQLSEIEGLEDAYDAVPLLAAELRKTRVELRDLDTRLRHLSGSDCRMTQPWDDLFSPPDGGCGRCVACFKAEIWRLQAEVRKQVFASKVVFDREVVERAKAAVEG